MGVMKFTAFGGEIPRMTKRALPDNAAQVAVNLRADSAEFRPLPTDSAPVTVSGPGINEVVKTVYRYPTDSSTIIGTPLSLALAKSPIAGDQYDRVYATTVYGESEEQPSVMQIGEEYPSAVLRPLGVTYPIAALGLTYGTPSDAFLKPQEVAAASDSLLEQIRQIVIMALQGYAWNPEFALGSEAGFREDPVNPGKGTWQRIFTNTGNTDPPTWNTYNGTPVANHLWVTQITNPPFVMEGSNKTFYLNFPAQVAVWRVKADVSAETALLQDLVIPGTTDRLLSDAEIALLWTNIRTQLPDDPTTTPSSDLTTLLARYRADYRKFVNYVGQGFDESVSPATAYQLVAATAANLLADVDGITTYYDRLITVTFDGVLTQYFKETKFPDKMPDSEVELVEVRFYTYTFVNQWGEESKPYLPGDGNPDEELPFIEVNQVQVPTITLAPGAFAHLRPNDNITHWRVYRSAAGAEQATFQFVTELPVATTSFTDLRKTESLSEGLLTTSWFPPPTMVDGPTTKYLKGIVQAPGQFLAGFLDNTVYFSEPGHAYAWPPQYAMPLSDNIIGLGMFGLTVVVLTEGGPYYLTGDAPATMSKVRLESVETCVSPRSITTVGGGVIFASQNGLCLATQQGVTNITANHYTKTEWQALAPATMICDEYDGIVYFSEPANNRIASFHGPSAKLTHLDMAVTAFYSDYANGDLYAVLPPASGAIAQYVKLQDGNDVRTAQWRSKRIILPKETPFAWLAVEGQQSSAQPLRVDIYGYYVNAAGVETQVKLATSTGDGTSSAVVSDTRPIRIAVGRFKDYEVEISGKCRIDSVLIVSSGEELRGVN